MSNPFKYCHYFLATKFAAYNSRGRNEPKTSHDFEDIVYVLDNRTDVTQQLLRSPQDVRPFLKSEFESMLADKSKHEAISGNLFYETRDGRFIMIMEKLKATINGI